MLKIVVATIFCLSITVCVHADPLNVTGQFSSNGSILPLLSWNLQGVNFSTTGFSNGGGGIDPIDTLCASPCPANVPLTVVIHLATSPNVSVSYNGFSATGSFLHSIFAEFNATIPFVVPTEMLSTVTVTVPFSNFTGRVVVGDPILLNGTPPFTVNFVGSGIATAQFRLSPHGAGTDIALGAVTLTFTVPEPATLWLIAGGLAGLGTMLKRTRKRE